MSHNYYVPLDRGHTVLIPSILSAFLFEQCDVSTWIRTVNDRKNYDSQVVSLDFIEGMYQYAVLGSTKYPSWLPRPGMTTSHMDASLRGEQAAAPSRLMLVESMQAISAT